MLSLVVGASASGKSEYAEALTLALSPACPRVYLATMEPYDAESRARVARHRALRAGKSFATVERPRDLAGLDAAPLRGSVVLLECLGTLAANQLYGPEGLLPGAYEAVLDGVLHLNAACRELVVVSNEVFLGGADYAGDTDAYLHLLARLNRRLAAESTRAVQVAAGLPLYRKGTPPAELIGWQCRQIPRP